MQNLFELNTKLWLARAPKMSPRHWSKIVPKRVWTNYFSLECQSTKNVPQTFVRNSWKTRLNYLLCPSLVWVFQASCFWKWRDHDTKKSHWTTTLRGLYLLNYVQILDSSLNIEWDLLIVNRMLLLFQMKQQTQLVRNYVEDQSKVNP